MKRLFMRPDSDFNVGGMVESSDSGSSDGNNSDHFNVANNHDKKGKAKVAHSDDGGDDDDDEERCTACPTCGIQLFRLRKNWWTRKTRLIPLNRRGTVENGICIGCSNDSIESTMGRSSDSNVLKGHDNSRKETIRLASVVCETTYIGDYNIYGQRHGKGEVIWNNGDRYVGNFFNGTRDGQGTLFFADGSEYSGSWACNRFHGFGTRRFTNGDMYCGSYKDGKRCGSGKFFFANGDLYVGTWDSDAMHGKKCKYFYSSGKCFEGEFRLGCRHGVGKTQYISGKLDMFCYDYDMKVGNGVRWSKNRKKVWMLTDRGKRQKRISIPEAISMQYQMEGEPELLHEQWEEWPAALVSNTVSSHIARETVS